MIRRPDLDDLDREIRDHLEEDTLANIARGMNEADARAAAIRKFGNVTRVKEDVRDVWVPMWIDRLRQDARDAWRSVRRSPALSLAIVFTLALGIGLTTAVYSVVNAVLLRPVDYANPDRVVWLTARGQNSLEIANSIDFEIWRSQATSLSRVVAYEYIDSTLVLSGEATRMRIVSASDGFWEITGARALFGDVPAVADPPAIALAHHVFREQFHGDPSIIGHTVTIDGREATIAAVLPADFRPQLAGRPFDPAFSKVPIGAYRLMRPQTAPTVFTPATQVAVYAILGELKPGVSLDQARTEIEMIQSRWYREHSVPMGPPTPVVMALRDKIVGSSRPALRILLVASVIVLLIACANVANLLLSRSSERRKEIALRISVGSDAMRVIRQLLAESMGHAILGGIGGVLFASWLVNVVVGLMGPAVPRLTETTLDLAVLAVAAATSIGTALLFGVGPAAALVFTNVQEVLKDGGRSVSASRRVLFSGRIMSAAQVALTIVLLAGAGLMFKSVWQMTRHADGFHPDRLLTMQLDFRGPQYRDQQARHTLTAALLAKAQALPGVREAAITTSRQSTMLVLKEGEQFPGPEDRPAREAPVSSISERFGPMLGMTIANGRWLRDSEAEPAAVINESLARKLFVDTNPIGTRIRMPSQKGDRFATIVGIARDLKYAAIDKDAVPEVFFQQTETPLFSITLVMRTDGDPTAAAPEIRKALSAVDPTQSFYSIQTMEQAIAESIAPRRFNLLLLGTFALVALVLAVLGVYGVVAYAVAERTHEIGIRLALGAERSRVARMIVVQGMTAIIVGIGAGLIGAWASARVIAGLIYGVQPHDVTTFASATIGLAIVSCIACAAPALKAALVDPVRALRAE
jgi:putative ABC transport system permease protein